jgi:hypothetical protein
MPAPSTYIVGQHAQDLRGQPVTGRQVAGQGNVAARGVGLVAGDSQGPLASTHSMTADKTNTVGAGASTYQAGAVWLDSVLVTTVGTVEGVIYDNAGPAGTATGTIIGIIPANTARGTVIKCGMPVSLGISAVGAANTPAYTFSYA